MYVYVHMPHFVYSFVDGHLSCLYLLAIVNNVAIGVQVSVPVLAISFSGIYLGVELQNHMAFVCFAKAKMGKIVTFLKS